MFRTIENTVINYTDSLSLATLVETVQGFTYRYGMTVPSHGFMVSEVGNEEIYELSSIDLTKVIDDYLERHCEYVTVPFSHRYIGGWVDNNKLYLDVSVHFECEEDAVCEAKRNNQLAYFCLDDMETIIC